MNVIAITRALSSFMLFCICASITSALSNVLQTCGVRVTELMRIFSYDGCEIPIAVLPSCDWLVCSFIIALAFVFEAQEGP